MILIGPLPLARSIDTSPLALQSDLRVVPSPDIVALSENRRIEPDLLRASFCHIRF